MLARAKAPQTRRTAAVEDYLEQILQLVDSKGYARVVDIASGLGISQASVTNMVQRLAAGGLLVYEKYRGLALTDAGRTAALAIARRHRLLADFLQLLGVEEDVARRDVEGMEHHISPSTLSAIENLVRLLREDEVLRQRISHPSADFS
jgi:Mn-dependent DtxR family transcriptional regulator